MEVVTDSVDEGVAEAHLVVVERWKRVGSAFVYR